MGQPGRTPKDEREEAQPEVEKKTEEPPKYRFQILADRDARWSESEEWKDIEVGHAWVRLIDPVGAVDSWGFWPAESVPISAPWTSVHGEIKHPDEGHQAHGKAPHELEQVTHEIDQTSAQRVLRTAHARETEPGMYNLFNYNCASFAEEMAKAAGVPVPTDTLATIANPSVLYASLAQRGPERGAEAKAHAPEGGESKK